MRGILSSQKGNGTDSLSAALLAGPPALSSTWVLHAVLHDNSQAVSCHVAVLCLLLYR